MRGKGRLLGLTVPCPWSQTRSPMWISRKQLQFLLGTQEGLLTLSFTFSPSCSKLHMSLSILWPGFFPHQCPQLCPKLLLSRKVNFMSIEKHRLCSLLFIYLCCSEIQERAVSHILQNIPPKPCNLLQTDDHCPQSPVNLRQQLAPA